MSVQVSSALRRSLRFHATKATLGHVTALKGLTSGDHRRKLGFQHIDTVSMRSQCREARPHPASRQLMRLTSVYARYSRGLPARRLTTTPAQSSAAPMRTRGATARPVKGSEPVPEEDEEMER